MMNAKMNRGSDKCKFCGERVDLGLEGATYKDGTCAHEECHDGEEFRKENWAEICETY